MKKISAIHVSYYYYYYYYYYHNRVSEYIIEKIHSTIVVHIFQKDKSIIIKEFFRILLYVRAFKDLLGFPFQSK